jgi:uncharacterized protein YndB with AHSA1/START domain
MRSLAFGIYLRATPQRVCQALADPALVPGWLAGMSSGPAGEEDPRRRSATACSSRRAWSKWSGSDGVTGSQA